MHSWETTIKIKNNIKYLTCAAICLMPLAIGSAADQAAKSPATYEPTLESLRQSEIPEWFIDGNLLLNVPLTGDGELEEEVFTMFKDMGHDFALIGEAVFNTRTWEAFGEGE